MLELSAGRTGRQKENKECVMDTMVTVTGNLTADPVQRVTASGATVVGLRLASSSRRFDREAMDWRDGDPMFINVSCWRTLAGNVHASLRKGDGVVVHGRLSMRTYDDRLGNRRTSHEVDAIAVGPDLTRYPVEVRRPHRPEIVESPETVQAVDSADSASPEIAAAAEQPVTPDLVTEIAA